MTPQEIIAKLRGLSRKLGRLENANYYGSEWRLVENEVETFLLSNLGQRAANQIERALHPATIRVGFDRYPAGDNVDPEWKAERVEAARAELKILIRDIQSGHLVAHQQPADQSLTDPLALFDALNLHPRVNQVSRSLFESGHYAQAIFEAFKTVNSLVKEKTGLTDLDDRHLMATAFDERNPKLRLNSLGNRTERNEQEGFKFIFMGSTQGIRNPKAHEPTVQDDPYRSLEYLALASLLARRAEEATPSP